MGIWIKRRNSRASASESSGDEPNSFVTSATGCAYLLVILLTTTCMLIVNAIVCLSIHSVVMSLGPEWLVGNPTIAAHVGQLFFFVVPVLLTIIQWNLLDRLDRLFRRP